MTEPKLEVPAELRQLVEKTIDPAEKAATLFFDAAPALLREALGQDLEREDGSYPPPPQARAQADDSRRIHRGFRKEARRNPQ